MAKTKNPFWVRSILLMAHPVGSYYWSSDSTSPAVLFGGTWERIKDKFVLAAGDTYAAGATGGEVSHVLTVGEMPEHKHGWKGYVRPNRPGGSTQSDSIYALFGDSDAQSYLNNGQGPQAAGSGQAHNNMPPYIAAYCWRRTA